MTRTGQPKRKFTRPSAARKTIATPSVIRSARMIGAEVAIGVPAMRRRRYDFRNSPTLPGVITIVKELKKIPKLSRVVRPRTPIRRR
jgi:hypothetical protein